MTDSPLVGIALPTHEPRADHLRAAIESVLAQRFGRWRLVVRDDASRRVDVGAIVAPYLADPRVTSVRGERRLGLGGSWNAALARLDEPLVQLLFQDDAWHPSYLERAVAALAAHPGAGFVAAHHDYLDDGGRPAGGLYAGLLALRQAAVAPGPHDGLAFLRAWVERGLWLNLVGEPSFVLVRRDLLARAGAFAPELREMIDVECWIRLLARAGFCWLPEALGTFRVHAASASGDNRRSGLGALEALDCFERLLAELPAGEPRRHALGAFDRHVERMLGRLAGVIAHGRQLDRRRLRALAATCARRPAATARGVARFVGGLAGRAMRGIW